MVGDEIIGGGIIEGINARITLDYIAKRFKVYHWSQGNDSWLLLVAF
jgi:uncharacterized protein (DUF2164 family)